MSKIIIVDDSADLSETLKYVLERKGYTVKTFVNDDNIYKEINEFQPRLLILDISFTGRKDRREICKELKMNVETEHLRVLAISAFPKNLADYESYRADDVMEKPFDLNNLLDKIKSLLQFSKNLNVTKDIF